MDEIEAMSTIAEKMEPLPEDARARVLSWATSKYGGPMSLPPTVLTPAAVIPQQPAASSAGKATIQTSGTTKQRSSKKAKSIISMDKSLNLSPAGKESAAGFSTAKSPSNVMQKCVVAVYYLRDVLELERVTVSSVYTFFKTLSWPVPADLKNTLQQAGTKGWLDTKDGENIKLTSMGENLVEHDLPPKSKA